MHRPSIALVVSFFNKPHLLRSWLECVARQSLQPDEVVIADDGSSPDAAPILESYRGRVSRLIHVWHPDHGYQRAKIMNRAIAAVASDYVVMTDCDCLPDRHFVIDHARNARRGSFVAGTRAHVRIDYARDFRPTSYRVLFGLLTGRVYNRKAAWRSPTLGLLLRILRPRAKNIVIGANLAAHRDAIISVNGFDETFVGWGAEDKELCLRLEHSGIQQRSIRNECVLYHLDHPMLPRSEEGERILSETSRSKRVRSEMGLAGSLDRAPACRIQSWP